MGEHSRIPPSSAHIWGKPHGCNGWVRMAEQCPELEETPEAAEGEASHDLAADMIRSAARANTGAPVKAHVVGTTAANGTVITEDIWDGAEIYAVNVITAMHSRHNYNPQVEQRLAIPAVHLESFGTPDCYLHTPMVGELLIWDYKFGHVEVAAFENWQCINYVAGIPDLSPDTKVLIRIVQPRVYHSDGPVREWHTTLADLQSKIKVLRVSAALALGDSPVTKTGLHCRYCQARHACEGALNCGMMYFEMTGQPVPVELPPKALGVQFAMIQRATIAIKALQTGYETQIKALIKSGTDVPGYSLEDTYGRRAWTTPIEEVIRLGKLMNVELSVPTAITPEKARKAGLIDDLVNAHSGKHKSGQKLATGNTRMQEIFSQ